MLIYVLDINNIKCQLYIILILYRQSKSFIFKILFLNFFKRIFILFDNAFKYLTFLNSMTLVYRQKYVLNSSILYDVISALF